MWCKYLATFLFFNQRYFLYNIKHNIMLEFWDPVDDTLSGQHHV